MDGKQSKKVQELKKLIEKLPSKKFKEKEEKEKEIFTKINKLLKDENLMMKLSDYKISSLIYNLLWNMFYARKKENDTRKSITIFD